MANALDQSRSTRSLLLRNFLFTFVPLSVLVGAVFGAIYQINVRADLDKVRLRESQSLQAQVSLMGHDVAATVADLLFWSKQSLLLEFLQQADDRAPQVTQQRSAIAEQFSRFLASKVLYYSKLQLLDLQGREQVRVEAQQDQIQVIAQQDLVDHGDHNWFQTVRRLRPGEIYLASMGSGLTPDQSEDAEFALRFVIPLVDVQGQRRGFLVLSYRGEEFLHHVGTQFAHSRSEFLLLDPQGRPLSNSKANHDQGQTGHSHDSDRGANHDHTDADADRENLNFSEQFPDAWQQIQGRRSGQFQTSRGLFTFSAIWPAEMVQLALQELDQSVPLTSQFDLSQPHWKLVKWLPNSGLHSRAFRLAQGLAGGYLVLLGLIGYGCWLLAQARLHSQQAKTDLQTLNQELEKIVVERTAELVQSQSQFQKLADNMPGMIYQFCIYPDGSQAFTYVSEGCRDIYEVEPEQMDDAFRMVHPDDNIHLQAKIWQSKERLNRFEWEGRITTDAGHLKWIQAMAHPELQDDGTVVWNGVVIEVSDRKQMEETLRQSEARNQAIVNAMPDLILRVSTAGIYLDYVPSEEVADLVDPQNVIGRSMSELLTPEIAQAHHKSMQAALSSGQVQLREQVVEVNGELRYEEVRVAPCGIDEALFIIRDITSRKQTEKALEQQLAAVEAAIDGIAVLRGDTYLYANRSHLVLFGYEQPEELVGKTWKILYSSDELERFEQEIFPVLMRDRAWQGEAVATRKDGSSFAQELSLTLTEDGLLICVCRDISDRKQAETQLREALSEAQGLTAILDNLADGLLVTNTRREIIRYNPAFVTMFGLQGVELYNQTCEALSLPALADLVAQSHEKIGQVCATEVTLAQSRIGQAVATTIFREVVANATRIWMGCAILVRDVTTEREIDQMKTDFISTVSHELRTPLTSILGFAAIIRDKLKEIIAPAIQPLLQNSGEAAILEPSVGKALKKVEANVGIIVSEAERLTALINDVLDIAKMEAGHVDWEMQPTSPNEVIEWAIHSTEALFAQSDLELVCQVEPNLPDVKADRNRLIQVMINLISNAVKFTRQGSVTIRAYRQDDTVQIKVIDTGVGIAPENRDRVFEKFKQIGDTLTEKPQGTGLGLSICKQIIDYHDGQIWLESELGVGSVFSIALPVMPQDSSLTPLLSVEQLIQQLRAQIQAELEAPIAHKKTILVVDDDPSIRELLRQSLEAQGYQVCEANNGANAIAQVRQNPPDLVILDVMMPQINGFDVAVILKSDPQTADIPLMILSILEDKERGLRLGVDCYLTKPISAETLFSNVKHLLSQGKTRRQVLIADRNVANLRHLSQAMQAQGYSVIEATGYQDCLEQAIAVQPDLIILDSALSREDNLLQTLRTKQGLEKVACVLLGDPQMNNMLISPFGPENNFSSSTHLD